MFQIDYALDGTRKSLRLTEPKYAHNTFDALEAAPNVDWIALTQDADNHKGYRVLSTRGGPGMPARVREGAPA